MNRVVRTIRETGAAAVELALVTPILIAMILGIVEFGLLWNYKAELNNATAIAARGFILDSESSDPVAAAKSLITGTVSGVTASQITICLQSGATEDCSAPRCSSDVSGSTVTVTVATERSAITRVVPGAFDVRSSFVALCQ